MQQLACRDPPLSFVMHGLCEGDGTERPSRLTLFRKNLEISCTTRSRLHEAVGNALLDAARRYLALDEDAFETWLQVTPGPATSAPPMSRAHEWTPRRRR